MIQNNTQFIGKPTMQHRLLFVVNVDWSFCLNRLPIAKAAQTRGYEVHIATSITDKQQLLEANGIRVHPLGLVRGKVGLINAIQTIITLMRIIKCVQPDVIHLVTIKPVILGGLVARWLGVRAVVSAVSGLGYIYMSEGLWAKLQRLVVNFAYSWAFSHKNQTVIFQNPNDREDLMAATGLVASKSTLIHGSGVDLKLYSVVPVPNGSPVVLLPARFLADKGIFEFVCAAKKLKAKGIVARFVLAGLVDEANPTSLKQAQIDNWVLEGTLENWGYCNDMPKVFGFASIVVLPSYREGLPKALIEAAACGRAVITTDVPGCRDVIEPEVTGLLVPARNCEDLAVAIEDLLSNHKKREAMGMAGRLLAERKYDVQEVIEKHLIIYNKLLIAS